MKYTKEQLRMQQIAGIITESEYKKLINEDNSVYQDLKGEKLNDVAKYDTYGNFWEFELPKFDEAYLGNESEGSGFSYWLLFNKEGDNIGTFTVDINLNIKVVDIT